jgi:hypothetical protein
MQIQATLVIVGNRLNAFTNDPNCLPVDAFLALDKHKLEPVRRVVLGQGLDGTALNDIFQFLYRMDASHLIHVEEYVSQEVRGEHLVRQAFMLCTPAN